MFFFSRLITALPPQPLSARALPPALSLVSLIPNDLYEERSQSAANFAISRSGTAHKALQDGFPALPFYHASCRKPCQPRGPSATLPTACALISDVCRVPPARSRAPSSLLSFPVPSAPAEPTCYGAAWPKGWA